ncbi:MAG: c-type cytochrome [SAR324 cluster bacterium]|nr:c-type cytochrome [SAR324 cluster bacterium]
MKRILPIVIFVFSVLGAFVYVGYVVTDIAGGGVATAGAEGVSPEAGETIFWGKGKCYTCHSIGDEGSAIRCPNLGENNIAALLSLPVGVRAEERAVLRSEQTGKHFSATDYLVESLADPGAYVVDGFKNEMPYVYKPPIGLTPDEVKAVILYLQSQGGEVDVAQIKLPDVILAAQKEEAEPWQPYFAGDPENGMELFFDEESNAGCSRCHTVAENGGKVGPELTTVSGTRSPQYIVESIIQPSEVIASGFESLLIVSKDGRYLTGIKKGEDEQSISLMLDTGEIQKVSKDEIEEVAPQETSVMPSGFADDLTMTEFHDVLAFVLTLDGEQPIGGSGDEDEEDDDEEESADEDSEDVEDDSGDDEESDDEESDDEESDDEDENGRDKGEEG